ncbi:protein DETOXIFICATION 53 isoform X2 [Daucus carota subsp. sativus]|uniref:protein DETOXIFICATION 53 isoform X2 n=1 Tax=Daucus carota subsp. sativus TaxID=79200 RepID=UPI0030836947
MCVMDESRGVANNDTAILSSQVLGIEAAAFQQEISKPAEDDDEEAHNKPLCGVFRRVLLNEVAEEMIRLGKISFPAAMTTLFMFSKSIISMMYLGHMGKVELAGGSLAISFANITGYSIMKGLCMGMDPICCQAYGAKRWSLVSQTYLRTFLLLLFTTIPISLLWLNVELLFKYLGQDRAITKVAKVYLLFSLPELLAHCNLHPLRSFLRTQGLTSPATMVATIATLLHYPATYFLVTYMNLGIKGIALASVLHAYNMNIGLIIYLIASKVSIKPWVGATVVSMFQGWRPLLSLAIPSACSVCLEWWWYEIILFLSGLMSNPESSVAAMGILIQTTGTIYVFPYALSLGTSQRVGYELGAGQPARARWAATVGVGVGLTLGCSIFGLAIALRSVWASGALTGSARPKMGIRINLAAFYLIGLPAVVVISFKMKIGFKGLWMGLVLSQAACLIMMVYTLMQTDWKHQAKRAEDLTVAAGQGHDEDTGTDLVP